MNTEIFLVRIDDISYEIKITTRYEDPEFVKTLLVQTYVTTGYIWADAAAKTKADFDGEWGEKVEITVNLETGATA